MWIEHSKMVMNEYRLNPLDPHSQKVMEEQMEQFFFGEGANLPRRLRARKRPKARFGARSRHSELAPRFFSSPDAPPATALKNGN